jgi:hypothetical protein
MTEHSPEIKRKMATYYRRKAECVCVRCRAPTDGRVYCKLHSEVEATRTAARSRSFHAAGRCAKCGEKLDRRGRNGTWYWTCAACCGVMLEKKRQRRQCAQKSATTCAT